MWNSVVSKTKTNRNCHQLDGNYTQKKNTTAKYNKKLRKRLQRRSDNQPQQLPCYVSAQNHLLPPTEKIL